MRPFADATSPHPARSDFHQRLSELRATGALQRADLLERYTELEDRFACLAIAMRRIELGTAYAVWSGVGTAVIAAIGIVWFREPASALKLFSLAFVIVGVVGLNLAEGRR